MTAIPPHYSTRLQEAGSLGQVARSSVFWAYIRTAVFAVIAVPTTVVLARLLSPADFGIAATATFFGQLAGRLSSGGLGSAVVRVKDLRPEHLSSVFVINVLMAIAGSVALIVAAPFIASFYRTPEIGRILPVVALTFAFGALSVVQQSLLARDLRYRDIATIGSVYITVAAISSVILALLGFQYWSLVLGDVIGSCAKWLYGVKVVGWHVSLRFVPAAARELSSFAFGSYSKRIVDHVTLNIGNLVVGRVLGITALGYFDKAFSAVNQVFEKMTVVGPAVSFRVFSIIQDDPERLRRAYRKVIMTVTLAGFVVLGTLAATAPHLIVVALGAKWAPSVVPFQILCASFALKLLDSYASAAAQARGWIWQQVWRQLVQLAVIVVGIYLVYPWGISAAALILLVASVLMYVLMQNLMLAATGLRWVDAVEPQIPALSVTAAIVALVWAIDLAMPGTASDVVVLATQVAVAGACVLAFVLWCPFQSVRVLLHEVLSDVSPRTARWLWRDVETKPAPVAPVTTP